MLIRFFVFLICFGAIFIAGESLAAENACSVSILELRPMQYALGKKEVRRKQKKISGFIERPKRLERYLRKKSVPVLIGPGRHLFMVDHHHTSLALHREGVERVYIHVIDDLSQLSEEEFWAQAEALALVRLADHRGRRISWEELARLENLTDLRNDRYRALAGLLRNAGGFERTDQAFMEFRWADFLRTRVPLPGKEISWKKALDQALDLAASDEAAFLHQNLQ